MNSALTRQAHLASGLVLFGYVTTHLINHTLGLWSVSALEAGLALNAAFWRNPLFSAALFLALTVHLSFAVCALYLRDSFRVMKRAEWCQLGLGFIIPLLLIGHVVETRYLHEVYGVDDSYKLVLAGLWVLAPEKAILQGIAIFVAWGHGCIGLYFWLRYKAFFVYARAYLLSVAVVVPFMALAGFISAGMAVRELASQPGWLEALLVASNTPTGADFAASQTLADWLRLAFLGLVPGALVARRVRLAIQWRNRGANVSYAGHGSVRATRGMTVLEVSRINGIPHASICGGRARCSTCRIRISAGLDLLPPPSEAEARVLARVGAPPNVRLACQTPVIDGLEVRPLLAVDRAATSDARRSPDYLNGRELEIAVLFADIRGFTMLSESRLPYDVVFILNRYFAEMGAAIEASGGRIDKFIGDGIMALFGIDDGPEAGARHAVAAAREMSRRLVRLNDELAGDFDSPLRIGMGIHAGPAIVGEMGYGRVRGVTAVGDTVNIASRLEATTKEHGAQLIVSDRVVLLSGEAFDGAGALEISVRGREAPLGIHVIKDAS